MADTTRPFNFAPGPAAIPDEVLREAAAEMLDWHGCGVGVMEMSHRGKEFMQIAAEAQADLRELLAVPAHFRILFLQGGGDLSRGLRGNNFNLYAQDTFKVTSRLTLNLGLRYELPFNWYQPDGQSITFIPGYNAGRAVLDDANR